MRTADEEAFAGFVREHRGRLLGNANQLTVGDVHLAEDLVQQTLTKVYRRWRRIESAPLAYARRTLVTTFIDDRHRARHRHEYAVAEVPEAAAREAPEPRPALMEALRLLAPRMRAAVVLRYVEDLSVEETARLLGCSTGNVKSQAARGLARLREHLADTGGSPGGPDAEATIHPLRAVRTTGEAS